MPSWQERIDGERAIGFKYECPWCGEERTFPDKTHTCVDKLKPAYELDRIDSSLFRQFIHLLKLAFRRA